MHSAERYGFKQKVIRGIIRLSDDDGNAPGRGPDNGQPDTSIILKTRPKTKKPSMYKVLLLNDDYTPMEFVVHVLERFFNKSRQEATDIMLTVHRRGVGVCGVFTFEVAETKVAQVMDFARANEQPLQCTMEKE
ncbi:MAG: ATP-dependent Clp protease adapter ClpS [Alphaproteobacteria bacterium]|nr:ATP-dependent Clp protease adapter ClpS [Alphaproteobacteria bacterium]QQS58513.1 MAG: ATP-dependent Clp protease adapter ClpS [Alphaproteobacteria bacterium]